MPRKQDLGASLQKLAQAIVDQALTDGTDLDVRTETLKVVGAFWISQNKIKLKSPDDEPDTAATFDGFRARINGAGKEANA
jgi:hypothetical protein